jgi:hypothetical protein
VSIDLFTFHHVLSAQGEEERSGKTFDIQYRGLVNSMAEFGS